MLKLGKKDHVVVSRNRESGIERWTNVHGPMTLQDAKNYIRKHKKSKYHQRVFPKLVEEIFKLQPIN